MAHSGLLEELIRPLEGELNAMRNALGVIVRNIDTGTEHISWISECAKQTLAIKEKT